MIIYFKFRLMKCFLSYFMKDCLEDYQGDPSQNSVYTFCDRFNDKSRIFYTLLHNVSDTKIKNIYRFCCLRMNLLHKKFPERVTLLDFTKKPKNPQELNHILCSYINDDKLKQILILHSLYYYHHPKKIKLLIS